MKVVIDIPKGMKEAFEDDVQWTALLCADMRNVLKNGIVLPDNATNGDVIKALFPRDVKVITQHDDTFGRRFIDLRVGQLDCELDNEWWNSPYKRGDID